MCIILSLVSFSLFSVYLISWLSLRLEITDCSKQRGEALVMTPRRVLAFSKSVKAERGQKWPKSQEKPNEQISARIQRKKKLGQQFYK